MLLLCVLVLGVFGGDVAQSMEGPRGKVTREMCSKPASQVPEEHWPYCCEGYGNHCEDFAASCYLNCQPVVSSGSDVTMVEERPGFCCALYNFCCMREFSRIGGNLQKVEVEEQFPTFHRFHVPGKQAPRWSQARRKSTVSQDVNNDLSESPSTVNRIGRTRTPSRSNAPRERQEQTDSRSSKSLDEVNNNFALDLRRSGQQQNRLNSQSNVVNPQRNSKPNAVKPQRNQVRFPQRQQKGKSDKTETASTSENPVSNIANVNENNSPSIQADALFGKTALNKKTELTPKNIEKSDSMNKVQQNDQQLNREAENRKRTLNRAGANLKATNVRNQESTPTNQPKSGILTKSQTTTNPDNDSENEQVKEENIESETTEQPNTRKQNNRRKVMIGRRVLVKTSPKKISNDDQESSKSIGSEQSKSDVKITANRRTLISNRQNTKTNRNNEQTNSQSTDSVQSRQESKPTSGRRTLIRNRQSSKRIGNNEQIISKSADSEPVRQEVKPNVGRRTDNNNRQTGSRRSRPITSSTKDSTRTESIQEESNTSDRSGDRNRGRRIKQTVRRVIPSNTQKESVKLTTATEKEQKEVLPKQRISITDRPVTKEIVSVASNLENNDEISKSAKIDQLKKSSNVKAIPPNSENTPSYLPVGQIKTDKTPSYLPSGPSNTDNTPSYLPLNGERAEELKLFLESTASKIIQNYENNQTNSENSEKENIKSKDEIVAKSPQEKDENNNQNPLEITKENEIIENKNIIETTLSNTDNPRQTRTRSRTTLPFAVTNTRNKATPADSETIATTRSGTRSRSRSRSSRTRNQVPTHQGIIPASTINTENTARRTSRRRGRQPT